MTKLFVRWILLAVSVLCASMVSNAMHIGFQADFSFLGFLKILVGVVILGFLNATLGRVLKILTLPISCVTFGLFSLVINAVMLMLAASFNLGFRISEESTSFNAFVAAMVASVLIAFINGILGVFLPDDKEK